MGGSLFAPAPYRATNQTTRSHCDDGFNVPLLAASRRAPP